MPPPLDSQFSVIDLCVGVVEDAYHRVDIKSPVRLKTQSDIY